MANDELRRSWERSEAFLLDARAHFSHAAEVTCCDELREFIEFLGHNEFELALDMLDAAFEKSGAESWRVLELMAMAAGNMGLVERTRSYDDQLSRARGWEY